MKRILAVLIATTMVVCACSNNKNISRIGVEDRRVAAIPEPVKAKEGYNWKTITEYSIGIAVGVAAIVAVVLHYKGKNTVPQPPLPPQGGAAGGAGAPPAGNPFPLGSQFVPPQGGDIPKVNSHPDLGSSFPNDPPPPPKGSSIPKDGKKELAKGSAQADLGDTQEKGLPKLNFETIEYSKEYSKGSSDGEESKDDLFHQISFEIDSPPSSPSSTPEAGFISEIDSRESSSQLSPEKKSPQKPPQKPAQEKKRSIIPENKIPAGSQNNTN